MRALLLLLNLLPIITFLRLDCLDFCRGILTTSGFTTIDILETKATIEVKGKCTVERGQYVNDSFVL